MKSSLTNAPPGGTSPYRLPSGLNERVKEKLSHVRELRNRFTPVRCAVVPAPLAGEVANLANRIIHALPPNEHELQTWEEGIVQLSNKLDEFDQAVEKAQETVSPLPAPPEPEPSWDVYGPFSRVEWPLAVRDLVVESLASRKDAVITAWGDDGGYSKGVCARFREREVDLLLTAYGLGSVRFLPLGLLQYLVRATSRRVTIRLRASIPKGIAVLVRRLTMFDWLGRKIQWLGKVLGSVGLSGDADFDKAVQVYGNQGVATALLTDSVRQLLRTYPIERLVIANGTVEAIWITTWAKSGVNVLPDPPVAMVVAVVESVRAALGSPSI
ncbi:MAG: hypothetical protein FWD73_16285 [Polyangiaceae bacterium]|nr:hypothetical protein [Polyangiaceae bacterium]